jgi:hypothetical protein
LLLAIEARRRARRLLEEQLATEQSQVELSFIEGAPTEFFIVGDELG